jgi:hypothetical protein
MCFSNRTRYKEKVSLAHSPATILKYLGRHYDGTLNSKLPVHTVELGNTQEALDIA